MRVRHAAKFSGEKVREPFTCGSCEFGFESYESEELLDHCRDIHGWFMCRNWLDGDGCEYQATDKNYLKLHMETSCDSREMTTK